MKKKAVVCAVLGAALALSLAAFAACDQETEEQVAATGITLSAETLDLTVGETETLTATVEPADSTDTVEWSTDDGAVATVSDGVVTAVAAGTATITATAGDASASCTVTVNEAYDVLVDSADELIAAVENTANEGKTIAVAAGSYTLTETVFVTQDLTLVGNGDVTLTAAESGWQHDGTSRGHSSIITVTNGADVTIRSLTVSGAKDVSLTGSGTDYGHGINLAQAGEVTLEDVTATGNDGVGILVNDTVATLKNVHTSGNGWGGVNVDVVGRDWTVPETVLTVDGDCVFAERYQIYCDDADETAVLTGKLDLPDTYTSVSNGGTVWTTADDVA